MISLKTLSPTPPPSKNWPPLSHQALIQKNFLKPPPSTKFENPFTPHSRGDRNYVALIDCIYSYSFIYHDGLENLPRCCKQNLQDTWYTRTCFVGVNTDCPLQSHKPNISYLIPANNDSTSDLKTFFSLRYIDDQKKLHG